MCKTREKQKKITVRHTLSNGKISKKEEKQNSIKLKWGKKEIFKNKNKNKTVA